MPIQIKRDIKMFHVAGDKNLADCIKDNEKNGYKLFHIVWTGNLEAKAPAQIVTAKGEDMKTGLIHLYLVLFLLETEMMVPTQLKLDKN